MLQASYAIYVDMHVSIWAITWQDTKWIPELLPAVGCTAAEMPLTTDWQPWIRFGEEPIPEADSTAGLHTGTAMAWQDESQSPVEPAGDCTGTSQPPQRQAWDTAKHCPIQNQLRRQTI